MALSPTIFKLKINLSDLDRNLFGAQSLTVAQHPSETTERMVARVLAYCLNVAEGLKFTRGLSVAEEPDIWLRSLDDQLMLWIDVGEPGYERIKKATRLAAAVKVYCFNQKSPTWWKQNQSKFAQLQVSIFQFDAPAIGSFASLVERTMEFSVTLSDGSAFISTQGGDCEVTWIALQ